ncbi:MAG: hypothetical protein ACOYNM_18225 [Gemmataceae bacterium]
MPSVTSSGAIAYSNSNITGMWNPVDGGSAVASNGQISMKLTQSSTSIDCGPESIGFKIPTEGFTDLKWNVAASESFSLSTSTKVQFQQRLEADKQITVVFSGTINNTQVLQSNQPSLLNKESGNVTFTCEDPAFKIAGIYLPTLTLKGLAYKVEIKVGADLTQSEGDSSHVSAKLQGTLTVSIRAVFGKMDDPADPPPGYPAFNDPPDDDKDGCRRTLTIFDSLNEQYGAIADSLNLILAAMGQDKKDAEDALAALNNLNDAVTAKSNAVNDLLSTVLSKKHAVSTADEVAKTAEDTSAVAAGAATAATALAAGADAIAVGFCGLNPIADGAAAAATTAAVTAGATATAAAAAAAAAEVAKGNYQTELDNAQSSYDTALQEQTQLIAQKDAAAAKYQEITGRIASENQEATDLTAKSHDFAQQIAAATAAMSRSCVMVPDITY